MSDSNIASPSTELPTDPSRTLPMEDRTQVVSTHVLVEEDKVEKLRELSKRTRIAQSEYLREAVDDLLAKYRKTEEP